MSAYADKKQLVHAGGQPALALEVRFQPLKVSSYDTETINYPTHVLKRGHRAWYVMRRRTCGK